VGVGSNLRESNHVQKNLTELKSALVDGFGLLVDVASELARDPERLLFEGAVITLAEQKLDDI
jgi:hypothetical protein